MLSESSEVNESTVGVTVSTLNVVDYKTLLLPAKSVNIPSSITIDIVPVLLDGGV